MFLDDTIPAPREPRARIPDGVNDTTFTSPGPYLARISRFTGPFWEIDGEAASVADDSSSVTRVPKAQVSHDTPGAIPRIRVHVIFEHLVGRDGDPLVLSTKYRASRDARSVFARLVAALGGIRPEAAATTNLDLTDFIGRAVSVTLKAGVSNTARIDSIVPAPIDAVPPQ